MPRRPGDTGAVQTREASQWTQPLQAAVAAFFLVSALVDGLILVAFNPLYRVYFTRLYLATSPPGTDVSARVDAAMTAFVAFTIVLSVVFLVLAALTLTRRAAWVFMVDMVALFVAGAPALVSGIGGVVRPGRTSLPPVFGLTQILLSLVALSLLILMSGLTWRYGVWAQRPASVIAE
jgi:hypothetical protein